MIVVSHRGPYRFERIGDHTFDPQRGAGGVVSALAPMLTDNADAVWIAAALSEDDRTAVRMGAADGLGVDLRLLDLDPEKHRLHYDVIANSVLWFLHHGLFDRARRPRFDSRFREAWSAYAEINDEFARATAEAAQPDDIVLVQDYQLALVPGRLRELRPDLRVAHFTHTPFCSADDISILPDAVGHALCRSLASVPSGFHTTRWADAYLHAARTVLGAEAPIVEPFAASLGPDVAALEAVAASPEARAAADSLGDIVGDRLVLLRSDRIEPSKNIVRGFLAFDRLLELRPELRGRVVFVALVYRSRQGLAEYLAYANEVEQAADRVNDRWARGDWLPVVLDDRDDFPRSVAGLQRYDVLLVNPLRDGLNLVAKEGPVVNTRDGVLCLSPEAGAFEELKPAALPLHPYDVEQAAETLGRALTMAPAERATRARRLRELATARTPAAWLADLVRHAR